MINLKKKVHESPEIVIDHATSQQVVDYVIARSVLIQGTMEFNLKKTTGINGDLIKNGAF